jgi:hypothetical protein
MALPPNFSFIWENLVAGSGHPGNGERLVNTLATLRENDVTAILSLSEEPLERALLQEFELDYLHLPIEDFTAPTPEQERRVQRVNGLRGQSYRVGGRTRGSALGPAGQRPFRFPPDGGAPPGGAVDGAREVRRRHG